MENLLPPHSNLHLCGSLPRRCGEICGTIVPFLWLIYEGLHASVADSTVSVGKVAEGGEGDGFGGEGGGGSF